ncbi:hypothetical protein SESBI_43726 [Sesbania bispinosa]|nr:hypothetical protein SESBI_43726 [Sesbania bispinosa]
MEDYQEPMDECELQEEEHESMKDVTSGNNMHSPRGDKNAKAIKTLAGVVEGMVNKINRFADNVEWMVTNIELSKGSGSMGKKDDFGKSDMKSGAVPSKNRSNANKIISSDLMKNVDTVSLDLSDEEDDFKALPTNTASGSKTKIDLGGLLSTPNVPSTCNNIKQTNIKMEKSNLNAHIMSNFCRPTNSQINFRPSIGANNDVPCKMLFHTPSPTARVSKVPKIEGVITSARQCKNITNFVLGGVNKYKGKMHVTNTQPQADTIGGILFPKGMKMKYIPTNNMDMKPIELRVFTYVYHTEKDPSEILLRIGNTIARRQDFDCLCPGKKVSDEVSK